LPVAAAVSAAIVASMYYVRIVLYPHQIVSLTYVVALLVGLWHRDRRLLWGMAFCFAALATYKLYWILPEEHLSDQDRFVQWVMQGVNIGIAAVVVHVMVRISERLERANDELSATNAELEAGNEELASREEELTRQNEELQSQAEELEQQAEELRTQAEELQTLNEEVAQREEALQLLLHLASPTTNEREMLDRACGVAIQILGEGVAAAAVLEPRDGRLAVQAHEGFGPEGPVVEGSPPESTLAALVMERQEVGQLEDTALRPDIRSPRAVGDPPFRAILSAPLCMQGEAFGVMEVFARTPRSWTAEQVQVLQWLASQCSRVLEILRLRDRLKAEQVQLNLLNQALESRVAERTEELQQRTEDLHRLASQLTTAEQRERRRLAQILHDDLQQLLVAAKMRLGRRGSPEENQRRAVELIDRAVELSRSLTVELNPPILFQENFQAALGWLARRMREACGLEVEVVADASAEPAGEDWRIFLFHAVRECLFNVAKHAGVGEATIRIAGAEGRLCVVVEDRGKGFDAEAVDEKSAGSDSFGLFSMRQRILLLGGAMKIASRPGEGTRVELSVPAAKVPPAVEHAPAYKATSLSTPSPPNGSRNGAIRVLLADDHAILRHGLASLLRDEPGIEVVAEAADGQIALDMARAHRPDVVVMDVAMPNLDGIEATRRLTAEFPRTKVIGMSMHEDQETAAAMRQAGAVGYLTKGGPADHLVHAIRHAAKDVA
jgi:signal transduction histidine kinase